MTAPAPSSRSRQVIGGVGGVWQHEIAEERAGRHGKRTGQGAGADIDQPPAAPLSRREQAEPAPRFEQAGSERPAHERAGREHSEQPKDGNRAFRERGDYPQKPDRHGQPEADHEADRDECGLEWRQKRDAGGRDDGSRESRRPNAKGTGDHQQQQGAEVRQREEKQEQG